MHLTLKTIHFSYRREEGVLRTMDAPKVGVLSFLTILQCIYDANFVFVWPSDQTKTWSGEKPFCWLDRDYLELFD